jgi:hypothetical protein
VAHELECVAYILTRKNDLPRAAKIFGAAEALRKLIGSSPTPIEMAEYDQEFAALRGKMNATEFEQAWEDGQRLNMEEAIALAMQKG